MQFIYLAAGCLYYHMSKILILESLLEGGSDEQLTTSIHFHAHEIASISLLSDLPDGAMVVTVNPVYYGANHTFQIDGISTNVP